jgi:hypothetical protein
MEFVLFAGTEDHVTPQVNKIQPWATITVISKPGCLLVDEADHCRYAMEGT